ncbi:MAG: hypothetical protein J7M26_05010, partial [Armatimonadetes bacterium]|nr:hypothetical protein [Armatimonadota bacterium]
MSFSSHAARARGMRAMLYYIKQGERGATPLQPLQRLLTEEDVDTLISCLPEMIQADVLIVDRAFETVGQTDTRADVLALGRDGTVFVVQFRQRVADGQELKAIERAATLSGANLEQLAHIYAESPMHGPKSPTPDVAAKILRKYLGGDALDPEPRIVVLAPEFTQELQTTANWLRGRGVDISCVPFRAYDLGGTWLLDVGSDGSGSQMVLQPPPAASTRTAPAASASASGATAAAPQEAPGGNGKATRSAPTAPAATAVVDVDSDEQCRLLAAVESMLEGDPLELPLTSGP